MAKHKALIAQVGAAGGGGALQHPPPRQGKSHSVAQSKCQSLWVPRVGASGTRCWGERKGWLMAPSPLTPVLTLFKRRLGCSFSSQEILEHRSLDLFLFFLCHFLMQSLKSADRQPCGSLHNAQTRAASPKGL